MLYLDWFILQKGVDAAALAKASYLEGNSKAVSNAVSVAVTYAQYNGIKNSELTADGGGNKAYVPGPNYTTITVTAKRTVPTLSQIDWSVKWHMAASATPDATGGRLRDCTSVVATPGSQSTVIPGTICSAVGQCATCFQSVLMPARPIVRSGGHIQQGTGWPR